MSPPRGGDSWKWSETENQSKPLASANFHSLRISASGPPMAPMWIPKFMSCTSQVGGRPERALRALERGEVGGRPARRLERQLQTGRQSPIQHEQRLDAFACKQASLAGHAEQRRPILPELANL